jgi:tRNA-splicing ligase RtcB
MIFGTHDENTKRQLAACVAAEEGARGVLCADGHLGYSMPIGGVVGYRNHLSPSGVGYDIGCGNFAVRTDIRFVDTSTEEWNRIADEIFARISFGVGRKNDEPVDDAVFDDIHNTDVKVQRGLLSLAQAQLGTVGSGNHYVDVLVDVDGLTWVACHFGSRGFGHKTASMFMNIAQGLDPLAKSHDGEMMSPPLLLSLNTPSGQDYLQAMTLAGAYAHAGRRHVVARVLSILGNPTVTKSVHNHHNYTWVEQHHDEQLFVVRKGATPAFPGQRGFIGGSMGDMCVIVRGVDSETSRDALYSTVHGAGRIKSRNAAIKGKHEWVCPHVMAAGTCESHFPTSNVPKTLQCPVHHEPLMKVFTEAPVDFAAWQTRLHERGVILRGAGPDEAPECYRSLSEVLSAHAGTIEIEHVMMPKIVCMAPKGTVDPFKD